MSDQLRNSSDTMVSDQSIREEYEPKEPLEQTISTLTSGSSSTLAENGRSAQVDLEDIEVQSKISRTNTRRRFSLKSEVPTVDDADSIPDGGLLAWLQVLAAFFLLLNNWGIINAYGVYQTYYMEDLLSNESAAAISWIGSVQSFLLDFVGPMMGPIYDAGYVRPLIATGTFLVVFGHMMLSLCTTYWQVFLAQAVCVGIGAGCLYVPAMAILSTYFQRNLPTAIGVAAAGSSLGGVIYPIVLYSLIPRIGFGWATRVIAFIALAGLLVSNCVIRVRVLPSEKRKIIDLPSFKEAPYVLFVIAGMIAFAGLYPVMVYVESFAQDKKLLSTSMSFYTLAIINSASVFGRILPNLLATYIGPMNVLMPATFCAGIVAFSLTAVRSSAPLIVICVLYGFFTGSMVSIPPTIFVVFSQHKRHMIGARMGMGFFIFSIGLLLGTPVSGWILDTADYSAVWCFAGALLIAGSAVMFAARTAKIGSCNIFVKV